MGLSNTAKGLLKPVRAILEEKGLGINADVESVNTDDATVKNNLTVAGAVSDYHLTLIESVDTSGSETHTVNIDTTFDRYLVVINKLKPQTSGNGYNIWMRLNGLSDANYDFVDISGTETTGATEFSLKSSVFSSTYLFGTILIDGKGSGSDTAVVANIGHSSSNDVLSHGNYESNLTVSSVTFAAAGDSLAGEFDVYGVDMQ